MTHLQNIATRQRKGLLRDALFVVAVALASVVTVTTLTQAVSASSAVAHR